MPSATFGGIGRGIATAGQILGPLMSAQGTIAGGQERATEATAQAAQLSKNAVAAQAVGQRNAINTDLQTQLVTSRQQAVAAASGAGGPGVVNIEAETKARGEYAALTDLYNGNSQAQSNLIKAQYTKAAGADATSTAYSAASKTLANGAMTLLDRYGGTKPDWFN